MKLRLVLLPALLLLGGAACRTSETKVSSLSTPSVRFASRARTWEVRCTGQRIGLVVLFQERGLARDSVYVVRNPWQQDLGLIDGHGRAYRYIAHREEPAWVGSGTIAAGAQQILGAPAPCELIELDPTASPLPGTEGAVPAAAHGADSAEPASSPSSTPPPDGGLPQSR